jgi:shikimate dehydrogenase
MTSPALQEIIAVLASPAAGNPSQYLFERALEGTGLDWRIITCDVSPERVGEAVSGAAAMGFRGCLLSGPLRRVALSLVASASPTARFAGGVGLVERTPKGFAGHVTCGRGVVEALRAHLDPAGRQVLVLGGGMTGRAVALELAFAGATKLVITDHRPDRLEQLEADMAGLAGLENVPIEILAWGEQLVIPPEVGIVVKASDARAALAELRPEIVVADVSPAAAMPPEAAAAGCCLVDGLEIRAVQAAIDFQLLTGVEADAELLREALDEYLS